MTMHTIQITKTKALHTALSIAAALSITSQVQVHAQAPNLQMPDAAEMQKMQAEAAAAQACFASIDQREIEAIQTQAQQLDSELKTLCAAGQRDKAQSTAMEYAMQVRNNTTLQTMRECGKKLTGMMKNMMPQMPSANEYDDFKDRHVCD